MVVRVDFKIIVNPRINAKIFDAMNVLKVTKLSSCRILSILATQYSITIPANTKRVFNIYTTSAQRLRRWSNIV